jgi:hypothetical protein
MISMAKSTDLGIALVSFGPHVLLSSVFNGEMYRFLFLIISKSSLMESWISFMTLLMAVSTSIPIGALLYLLADLDSKSGLCTFDSLIDDEKRERSFNLSSSDFEWLLLLAIVSLLFEGCVVAWTLEKRNEIRPRPWFPREFL